MNHCQIPTTASFAPFTLTAGSPMRCPHCQANFGEAVEDFVIPGRVGLGSLSKTDCGDCDRWFSVALNADGTFRVSPTTSPRE